MNSPVINHKSIKNYNRRKILNLLSAKRELTKQAISLKTGISLPTVASNIQELIEEGLVEDAGMAKSSSGRKPLIVRYLPDARVSFGMEFTPEKIRILLTNLDSEIQYESELNIESLRNIDDIIKRISAEIERILVMVEIPSEKVLGIGFALPGTVNQKKMTLELAPNLGMKDICFKPFESVFHYPVFIENEANAGALAELKLGKSQKSGDLIYIAVARGVGAGIIIHGKLYKGKKQRAGEFGHMTILPGGKLCNCGSTGCWELYTSENALMNHYKKASGSENRANFKISDFLELLESGDTTAKSVWEEYLDYFALGIRNIILGLDPQLILIGGEIGQFGDLLIEPLKQRIFKSRGFDEAGDVLIDVSRLGTRAPALGAALLPILEYLV
jgi:predicted NBD/HSP70 family sugar kinase